MRQITMRFFKQLPVLFFAGLLTVPTTSMALNVEGNNYPDTVTAGGKTLKLVGAGVREKWFFDIYAMGAYSESGSCDWKVQMKNDEARYMRIVMLRSISAEKISEAFREAFENNTPPNPTQELKDKIKKATNFFQEEAKKGSTIEFIYSPGQGMTFTQNGKKLGLTIKGKDFADVVWNCYFSNKTCCKHLKKGILSSCKAK